MEWIFTQEQQKDGQFFSQYEATKHLNTKKKLGTYFVPKFNHEQRTGFMSTFRYIGKVQTNGNLLNMEGYVTSTNQPQHKNILFQTVLYSGFFQINIQKQ